MLQIQMPLRRLGTSGRGLRIMSSKRALITILATVCLTLGIYLAFFNHPPANETLAMNLEHSDHKFVPSFKHLHSKLHPDPKSSVLRALNISDSSGLQQSEVISKTHLLRTTNSTTKSILIENNMTSTKHSGAKSGSVFPDEEQHKHVSPSIKEDQNDLGNNAEEEILTKDHEDDIRVAQKLLERNVGRSKEYGPHHIRLVDWDGWVKKNNYIDIGTIWAYCDDTEHPPPTIGKVMMKKDEEYGSGVKIVITMNSTFEENIEYGHIGLSVDVNGIHFFSKKYDACAMVTQSEFFRCPMLAGDKYFYIEQHVPAFLPTGDYYGESELIDQYDRTIGEYYVESQLIDQYDRTIVCAQVKMTL